MHRRIHLVAVDAGIDSLLTAIKDDGIVVVDVIGGSPIRAPWLRSANAGFGTAQHA
jgi:hypothetical protein